MSYFIKTNSYKRWTSGTAAPTEGTWLRGDICWNQNPTLGGYIGWVCTSQGTPGTWRPFGLIEDQNITEVGGSID